MRFDEIARVRWHQTYASRFVTRSLDLHGRNGSVKITQVMPAAAGPEDPRVAAYVHAVRSVLTALSRSRPELRVEMSRPPLLRWFLFGSYLAFLLVLLFVISAVLGSRNASDLWWVTAVLVLGVLFCLVLTWRGRPWKEGELMAPGQLARTLVE